MMQYKTAVAVQGTESADYASEIRELREKLTEQVELGKILLEENQKLVSEYEAGITEYIGDRNDAGLDSSLELLREYRIMAGLTDVSGPGITITMNDASVKGSLDPTQFIIHDMDIIRVLNELKGAGAQAIAINGERILNVSEIMCAGPTVIINRNRYPTPYVIDVIGDPVRLMAVFESSLIYELLKDYDISVKMEKRNDIIIKKYYRSIEWAVDSLTGVVE